MDSTIKNIIDLLPFSLNLQHANKKFIKVC